jgi:hypothetical protein
LEEEAVADAIEVLKDDHRRVEELFKQFAGDAQPELAARSATT